MIAAALASFLAIASHPAPAPGGETVTAVEFADVTTFVRSVIIRIPARKSARYRPAGDPPPPPAFKERKGPKCIDAAAIGGAAITTPDSVDFILKGGKRVRAKLQDECPSLDYYSGFYVRAPQDGKICADRDSVHTRSGGDCQIDRFRALTPIDPAK
ncbi:hypothetical protein [Sphingomonas oryzagri]